MTLEELERKSETEGLTVEEVIEYQKLVTPVHHVYGKYGTLAQHSIEEHNFSKLLSLAGRLPEYLHGVDKAANDLYDVMYEKLSKDQRYKRTGNYLEDVRHREEIHRLIEEEILNEIVYVD